MACSKLFYFCCGREMGESDDMMRARNRRGFGWERWSTQWLHATLGLFNGYRTRLDLRKALSAV